MQPYQRYFDNPPRTRRERVGLLLEAIRVSIHRTPEETVNQSNVRHMESFLAFLSESFAEQAFRAADRTHPPAADAALEPLARLRARSEMRGQYLEGDDAIEARVPSLIHLAHAAFAELLDDLVVAERSPDHRWPSESTGGAY